MTKNVTWEPGDQCWVYLLGVIEERTIASQHPTNWDLVYLVPQGSLDPQFMNKGHLFKTEHEAKVAQATADLNRARTAEETLEKVLAEKVEARRKAEKALRALQCKELQAMVFLFQSQSSMTLIEVPEEFRLCNHDFFLFCQGLLERHTFIGMSDNWTWANRQSNFRFDALLRPTTLLRSLDWPDGEPTKGLWPLLTKPIYEYLYKAWSNEFANDKYLRMADELVKRTARWAQPTVHNRFEREILL